MSCAVPRALRGSALLASTAIAACFAGTLPAHAQSVWLTPEYFRSGALAQVGAAEAYALGFTGAGVRVGILDSGLDTAHPEFAGRVRGGYDFENRVPIGPDEDHDTNPTSHGTHVAGIIAAGRNGIEMQGLAFNALLTPVAHASGVEVSPGVYSFDGAFYEGWTYLAEQGVKIVNNSIGVNNCPLAAPPCNVADYGSRAAIEAALPRTIAAMRLTAASDMLMVFATGNESQPNPDALGGMPYYVTELRDTFLAVTAVDPDNLIAVFSNHCGVAKQWCLSAPGVNIYSTVATGSGGGAYDGYAYKSGTSMATPVVTAVAALVKEAFPFASAHDIQQILLTTATDLGAPGVDEVYGWGLVNAAKAVRGYGAFVSDAVIDTKGFDATFTNDISGSGGLIKTGAGTLSLTGNSTFSGESRVEGGTLALNGTMRARLAVAPGGTLRGTGTLLAPLAVAGRLAPGNSPGTLTVAGPVAFAPGSVFQSDIDGTGTGTGAGNYSRLLTTGTTGTVTVVGGTLAPVLRGITGSATNTYVPPLGSSYRILEASAGLTGSFTGLTQPTSGLAPATRFDTLYAPNSLTLVVTPAAYGSLAGNGLFTTANINAAGSALDSLRPTAGTALAGPTGSLFATLYGLAPVALPNALTQLSGEAYASAAAQTFDDARQVRSAIFDRVSALSGAPTGTPGVRLAPGLDILVWATGYGGWGQASGAGAYGLSWTQSGFIAGADIAPFENTRLGLAFGVGQSSGDVDALASAVGNGHTDLALYGVTTLGAWRASYAAAYSWNSLDLGRTVSFGNFANALSGDASGHTAQLFGEVSYGFGFGAAQVSPFLNAAYIRQDFSGLQEFGGAAALGGSIADMSTTLTTLGAEVRFDLPVGNGRFTPSARLGWQHAFGDTQTAATLWLAGSAPFTVTGTPIARDALALNLAIAYAFNGTLSAAVAYDGVLASDAQSSALKANLRLAF